MCSVLLEDLSKSDDKEEMKKEGEDGKGAKKGDDPEVILLLYPGHLFLLSVQCNQFWAVTLYLHLQFFLIWKWLPLLSF